MNSIRHGIANLLRFTGRDRPARFWQWAGAVLGCAFIVWAVVVATQIEGMSGRVAQVARDHPEQVRIEQGPGHYSVQVQGNHPELMPDFTSLLYVMAGICLVTTMLLAASVVRRLHDSGAPGWPALIPLALLANGLIQMGRFFDAMRTGLEPDMTRFMLIFLNNAAYLLSLGVLVYFLIRDGTPGPNRFGDPPQ